MKKVIIIALLCIIIPIQIYASCSTATTTRMWDVLSANNVLLLSVNSTLNQMPSNAAIDFAATFTTIQAISQHYSSAISTAGTVLSTVGTANSAIAVTQTIINPINSTINLVNQDIGVIQINDFGGTFSTIQAINNNVTSQFATLSSSLQSVNLALNVISGSQLANFLTVMSSIASISSVVGTNLQLISQISGTVGSDFDAINSALSIVLGTNTTLSSKISRANIVAQQDFVGTWTALATLATIVTAVDATASILDLLFLPVDVSLINIQLQTINSAIDFTTRQLNTSNATLSTITSFISPISTHLDTINSNVDVLNRIEATISSDTSSLVANVATINSLCDITIQLESILNMQVSRLDSDAFTLAASYSTLNSRIDIANLHVSTIGSLANNLNSTLVADLATILSNQSTIESLNTVLFTISSTLDQFGTLQSHIGFLNTDIKNDIVIGTTILSKTNALYTLELSTLSTINTVLSKINTLDMQMNTLTSAINILDTNVVSLTSNITNTTLPLTNTITSKSVFVQSSVNALDLTVQQSQNKANTIISNLVVLHPDFQQTWTMIAALQSIANSSNSLLISTESALSIISNGNNADWSGTFTALAFAQSEANSILNVLESINPVFPDTAGTFTALATMQSISSDMLFNISSAQSSVTTYNFGVCIGNAITAANIGTSGYTISSGGNYFLSNPVTFSPAAAANAITINANNVVLDLAGNTITQGNTIASVHGIVINPSISNVIIKNGIIYLMTGDNIRTSTATSNIKLEGLILTGAGLNGIDLVGTASNVIIRNVAANQNNFSGIAVSTGSDITIADNTCFQNGGDGINITPGSGVLNRLTINNCSLQGNSGNGIGIYGTAGQQDEIVLTGCSIMSNLKAGISASSVTRSVFKNNLVESNSTNGISLINAVADIEVSYNIIHLNTGVGIYVQNANAQPCSFLHNVLCLNTTNNYLEAVNAGPHSILGNYALSVIEANNYTISGGAKATTINKATIGQTIGTFSVKPGEWRNISETTT